MPDVRVGVVAFGFSDSFFLNSLERAERFSDSVFVAYGRFRGFEEEYRPCPVWLREWAQAKPGRTLAISDQNHDQHKQRDIYLQGMSGGDILLVMDSDWFARGAAVRRVFRSLRSSTAWDSLLLCQRFPRGSEPPQFYIGAYRFREGWHHGRGQVLVDPAGQLIASPQYRVLEINPEAFHFYHLKIAAEDPQYGKAQQEYWRKAAGR